MYLLDVATRLEEGLVFEIIDKEGYKQSSRGMYVVY
jgi:hypothetical protein